MNADVAVSPVRPSAIAEVLRDDILRLAVPPGATVTEAGVAVRFGCARPTARAGIDRLVAEGILLREAHRAARVPVLSRVDIEHLYDARAVVESAALAALAHIGSVPAAAVAAHRRLADADPDDGFADDDITFHRALVAGQPNERLARMHASLMGEIELCIGQVEAHRLLSRRVITREHQRVLDAVVAGDPETAAERTAAHIAHSRDRILAHWDSQHRTPGSPSSPPPHPSAPSPLREGSQHALPAEGERRVSGGTRPLNDRAPSPRGRTDRR